MTNVDVGTKVEVGIVKVEVGNGKEIDAVGMVKEEVGKVVGNVKVAVGGAGAHHDAVGGALHDAVGGAHQDAVGRGGGGAFPEEERGICMLPHPELPVPVGKGLPSEGEFVTNVSLHGVGPPSTLCSRAAKKCSSRSSAS
mmetsp:Transcript_54600/g.130267  ORF Transcript_54600/g.130267 Transcript_54600/m.130267 type:complete len:140 (+) Transcript_54600:257-676(+)